ncbi:MAG TPA: hypothetical protein VK498_06225 [Ferruginibacter sp.]|nr:hypothetical protein [Ferruginibacter sp.]
MNIIGTGRAKKKISRILGNYQKKKFDAFIYSNKGYVYFEKGIKNIAVEIELVTFVNSASFPDLILSCITFMKVVGIPRKWTLYIDDELNKQQKAILSKLSFVYISSWDIAVSESDKMKFTKKWQLRKFAAYAGHVMNGTTIYLDSDVLFYPLFKKYVDLFKINNWYLPEPPEANNINDDLFDFFNLKKQMFIVNAGFFVLNIPPDWKKGFDYLDFCYQRDEDHYFLDQSALNILYYHDQHAKVLDPRVFHVSANDHFMISALETNAFAIRHYVGLIRHKMWQLGWKIFFK